MWDNLKASIASVVRTNNNQEITGANLQNVLNTIVNTVGANATFAGIAIPSTNPGTPDGPVFYIACEPGVYSNFNLTLVDGLYILENKTGSWVGTQINTGAAFEALIGYYNAVLNGASITVPDATTYRLTVGGDFKLKMLAPGTTATTLTIGNATDIPIWYNGAAVSAQNTWEADEIISVFYDGTRFMASNSQGGGGKAEKIKYNNSQSGLVAENVQDAIDEVVGQTNSLEVEVNDFSIIPTVSLAAQSIYIDNSTPAKWKSSTPYKSKFVPISSGKKYRITSNGLNFYAILSSNTYTADAEVTTFANGTSGRLPITAGQSPFIISITDSNAHYLCIRDDATCPAPTIEELLPLKEQVMQYLVGETIDLLSYNDSTNVITDSGVWKSNAKFRSILIPATNLESEISVYAETSTQVAWLKNNTITINSAPNYCTGTTRIDLQDDESIVLTKPSDANYLYVLKSLNNSYEKLPMIAQGNGGVVQQVGALNKQVGILTNKVNSSNYEPFTFEQGSIGLDGVTLLDVTNSIRTGYFGIDKGTTIKLKSGFRIFRLFAYNADKTFKVVIINNGTSQTQFLENTTLWYRMVVARSDSSDITPDVDCVDMTLSEKLNEEMFDEPARYVFVAAHDSPAKDQMRADYICTGTNDELVIQQAVKDQKIRYGGTLQLLDGTYYIDSFPNTDSDGNHVAILFGGYAYDNARVLDVTGTTRNKGYNSEWGVSIHVTSTAIAAMNNTDTYVIFKGINTRPSLYPDYTFVNTVNFYKMNIYIGDAEKKMVGIDMTYFAASFLEDIQVWTESYNAKRMNHQKPPTPVDGSVGIKTMNGSNDMCRVRWSFVSCCGMHKGFVINSVDHLIMMNCAACRCVYGFYFVNGTPKATLTLISCIDEGCVHLPYFGGRGHITALSFAVERFDYRYYPDDPAGNTEFYAQEATPGNWIGTIEYTIQGWSSADGTKLTGTAQHFWKNNGSGKCIRTRNLNSDHTGYSMPNAGEYLEQYFDTNTNTWKTWNGSAWV